MPTIALSENLKGFQLSNDPLLIDKVRDIVGLYLDPPHHAQVLCVDEKSQIQALSRSQPVLPMRVGQLERGTHDYQRHGITSLFAALNIATGQVERWFALLTERQLERGSHRSVQELQAAIREFIAVQNQQPKPFRWTKSADQILASIARFASSTLAAHRPKTYARNQ